MNGFLMMMTQNGKLLYISDNAAEYLGHSMVSRHFFYFSILSAFYLSEWKSKRTVGTNVPVPRAVSWRVFFDYLNILSSFPPPPFRVWWLIRWKFLRLSTLERTFQSKSKLHYETTTCFVCFIYPVRLKREKRWMRRVRLLFPFTFIRIFNSFKRCFHFPQVFFFVVILHS